MKQVFFLILCALFSLNVAAQTDLLNERQTASITMAQTNTSLKSGGSTANPENSRETIPANASLKFAIEFVLLLLVIYFGIKYGGIALGLLGGLGVALLVLGFRDGSGKPPIDVMLIILAVTAASSTLKVTGALQILVNLAEKVLRNHPKYVVYLAPTCTFLLTVLVGTGHAVYPLFPVIYDVAYKRKVRPERPMAIASIASQMGITASPVAAAAATMIGVGAAVGIEISLVEILRVTIPACFLGVMVAAT